MILGCSTSSETKQAQKEANKECADAPYRDTSNGACAEGVMSRSYGGHIGSVRTIAIACVLAATVGTSTGGDSRVYGVVEQSPIEQAFPAQERRNQDLVLTILQRISGEARASTGSNTDAPRRNAVESNSYVRYEKSINEEEVYGGACSSHSTIGLRITK